MSVPMVTGLGFGVTSGVKAVEGEKATLEFDRFDQCPIFSQSRFIHRLIHFFYSLDEWFVGAAASCGGGKRFKEKDSCTACFPCTWLLQFVVSSLSQWWTCRHLV